MKTITNDQITQYRAFYTGSDFAMLINNGSYKIEKLNIGMLTLFNKEDYLLLTPLEQINDDDIDEMVRICPELQMNDYENLKRIILNDLILDCLKPSQYYKFYQYLQSKGYALPYLDYSVSDLVELNVIKLKQ